MMIKKPIWQEKQFNTDLHARWAVFFSAIGVKWIYQDRGFKLQNGVFFMPTFWLPTFEGGMYVEARNTFDAANMECCFRLCQEQEKSMLLAEGVPDFKVYSYYQYRYGEPQIWRGLPNADEAYGEDRMLVSPSYEGEDGRISSEYYSNLGEGYVQAIEDARIIKFSPRLVF